MHLFSACPLGVGGRGWARGGWGGAKPAAARMVAVGDVVGRSGSLSAVPHFRVYPGPKPLKCEMVAVLWGGTLVGAHRDPLQGALPM